jgi:hypothetical protein
VGFPEAVKESTAPLVKSTLIDFPNAVSAGHAAGMSVHTWEAIRRGTYLRIEDYSLCMFVRVWARMTVMSIQQWKALLARTWP